jgi:hypothetical protein
MVKNLLSATSIGCAVLLIGASSAVAGDGSGGTSNLAVSYSASPAQFDGSGCIEAPISITFTKQGAPADDVSGSIDLEARYPGSNSSLSASKYVGFSEPAQGTATGAYFFLCGREVVDGATTMEITGTVESSINFGSESTSALSASQLNIIQNPTKLSKAKVVTKRGFVSYRVVSGTAKATTVTKGVVGASGRLALEVRKPGSKSWKSVSTTGADSFGKWSFSFLTLKDTPKGSAFRVTLSDCGWCTKAQETGKFK